jgi:hypothetical protein
MNLLKIRMMKNREVIKSTLPALIVLLCLYACTPSVKHKNRIMKEDVNDYSLGTYGYDVAFFSGNNIETLELSDPESEASILVVPSFQGRVMTSTASGKGGTSFGWINYDLIRSGELSDQFNPFGGEERLWLGPEGGPFSIYFKQGEEQIFSNWKVPGVIDTDTFEIKERGLQRITFTRNTILRNASGTEFKLGIERKVSLLPMDSVSSILNIDIPPGLNGVAYQSDNIIRNRGNFPWTRERGLLSIWMLSMFNPTEATTVFIPYDQDGEGTIVNDDYFGKVPPDRLIVEDGTIFFKIDGKYRSKIGVPYGRTKSLCGSYDSERKVLTLLWCSIPSNPHLYVNSKWGPQEDSYNGDVINSYNDGPVEDGSVMGPFYEIETSSPGMELLPGESMKHTQRIIHFQGDESALARIVSGLFDLDLEEIAGKFQ